MDNKKDKSSENSPLQEGLKLLRRCPLCKHEFGKEAVSFLEQSKQSHLVHITCPRCQNAVLAVVLISPLGMSSVGVLTDLGAGEVIRLRGRGRISEEDILNFYRVLRKTNNFEKILSNN